MCGIIGMVSEEGFSRTGLLERLKRLEYRGYDSYGFHGGGETFRRTGEIVVEGDGEPLHRAIAHTRWATHGPVTVENAHPHLSCDGRVAIVHNGIIENHAAMRGELEAAGHTFRSGTDSEIIAHFLEEELKVRGMMEAIPRFLSVARGTFAILVSVEGDDGLYALKRDSPLLLGTDGRTTICSSDYLGLSDLTREAYVFENGEFARFTSGAAGFFDSSGSPLSKEKTVFPALEEAGDRGDYPHFMLKEIMEEPAAVRRLLSSLRAEQKEAMDRLESMVRSAGKVAFVASGTSYHASLLGVFYLQRVGLEAQTIIASEFEHFVFADPDTLVIAISQSGETMDVIDALKSARSRGAKVASLLNVPYSTIQRMSDLSLNIAAGPEVCVAATKTFVNQCVLLLELARRLGFRVNLDNLPGKIGEVLSGDQVLRDLACRLTDREHIYVIGRGLGFPVALEIALKLKEITYIHAEGMMGGELKHGTLALVEEGTPLISLISGDDAAMVSNSDEAGARGAAVIRITNEVPGDVTVNTSNDGKFGVLATIAGQLLTYYIALEKGLPIDKPRNLAKSVTVK